MAVSDAIAKTWNPPPVRADNRVYGFIDRTLPPAPGTPSLTALSDHELQFNCVASVDLHSTVSGYKLYLSLDDGGPYAYVWNVNFSQFPYTITQLSDGTPLAASTHYYGKITAVDIFGNETLLASCTQVDDTTEAGSGGSEEAFFTDDFGYTVNRVQAHATKLALFQAAGWTSCRDVNQNTGTRGYVYTVADNAIPGHESTPSPSLSGRVLCFEGLPNSSSPRGQTDFYLQLGDGTQGSIPADLWIQFWMLINRRGNYLSDFNVSKIIYPLHAGDDGAYPNGTNEDVWRLNGQAKMNHITTPNTDAPQPEPGALSIYNTTNPSATSTPRAIWNMLVGNNPGHLYPNVARSEAGGSAAEIAQNSRWIRPDVWQLCKYHIDISGPVATFEGWKRAYGFHPSGFNKIAEFIPGVTNLLVQYVTVERDRPGPRRLRMPTTIGAVNENANPWIDVDYYWSGFQLATTEAGLRTYGSF